MRSLTEIPLRLSYRTGRDDLVRDFFEPCLQTCTRYRRAAGYFTSMGLALAARGVASLAARRGSMQLVVSPYLNPDDVAALQQAATQPAKALRAIVARNLADLEDALVKDRLNTLAWLAASGLLEIKLAIRLDRNGTFGRGLFHEKIGIFTDDQSHHVSFSGSSNETAGGLVENFESIKVFRSWLDPEDRVQEDIDHFQSLWNDTTPGLQVIDFSKAGEELLSRFRNPNRPPPGLMPDQIKEPRSSRQESSPSLIPFAPPPGFELRPYQKEAIRAWSQAKGKGILAMATGSGKTLTALTLASRVAERNKPLVLVVVCPFINLCQQWIGEMAAFGLEPVACFEGRDRWQQALEEGYQRISLEQGWVHAIVTTHATFISDGFQAHLQPRVAAATTHHLLIADEVHNLGAIQARQALPEGIALRLGLSATPERHYDPVGTAAVLDYFGGIVYEYPLAQAIADGRLSGYRYHPVPVTLTEEETAAYWELSAKLARFFPDDKRDSELERSALRLLIKRARLLGGAANKPVALSRIIRNLPQPPHKALFYCGDGTTTDAVSQEEVRQIQAVARLLGENHGLRVRNFTYREKPQERQEILRDLASGFLDGVVAIRCLDEGIDLPDLRMGFLLASSTNPRQFIQRRGRLLRNAPGKQHAIIYDFFVSPPTGDGDYNDHGFNMERAFFKRELSRITEFCRMAENGAEALHTLRDLRLKYNLLAG